MAIYQNKIKIDENKDKVIKTKDGRSWYFRDYYLDIYGNKKQYKSPFFASKGEAQEAERKWLDKISKEDTTSQNMGFLEVFEEWQKFRSAELKPQTACNLINRTDRYIKSYFIDYKLQSIKLNIINKWRDEISEYKFDTDYKNKIIKDLKSFLEYCSDNYEFDNKIISRLQTFRVDAPNDKLNDSEINFWTYDEWKTFINVVDDYDSLVKYNFLYFTGVRIGEFRALNWTDFDEKKKTIRISKSLTNKVKGKKFEITTPKTKNSERIIDLDDNLYKMMIEYKKYKSDTTYKFNENDFIFGVGDYYLTETTFRRHLNEYMTKAEMKRITPHGFRHSHVSLLIYLGCDVRDVAERIGDTVEEVEKTYYHMFPKKKKMTVEKLNNL